MTQREGWIHTGRLSGAAYAGMFVFGIVMALLGAVLPPLSGRLEFQVSDIGTLFLVMNFAMLASSLVLGLAMDRFGMKPPLAGGPILVAAALLLIVRAAPFSNLLPAVVLLGIGGGALNGATNTLVADLHEDPKRKNAALNLLGVFFGFGALFLPFVIGALLTTFGVDPLLRAAAALCAAAGGFALLLRFPAAKQRQRLPFADMPGFLRSPAVLAMAFLLFFESGVEFTLGGYISTFLTAAAGVTVSAASWILAAYWASIMLARAVLSRLLLGIDPHRVVLVSALGACAGAALTALTTAPYIAVLGIVLTGGSLSGIYPTVLGIAGAQFRTHSGTVFGILFTVALTGGMLIPWTAGQVAAVSGLRSVFVVVAIAFIAIAVLSRAVALLVRRDS
jgi:FHS family glucose/mannose:H+ symporter-like MFS transporter